MVRRHWELADALEFAELMIGAHQFEVKLFGLIPLGRFGRQFDRARKGCMTTGKALLLA